MCYFLVPHMSRAPADPKLSHPPARPTDRLAVLRLVLQ